MPTTVTNPQVPRSSFLRRRLVIGVLAVAAVLCLQGKCPAQTDALQAVIQDFCHTNIPVSHAICLLAKQSPVPIDAVIDDTNDPPVTVSEERATVAQILPKLLALHPGHHPHNRHGVILILPDWLLDKQEFPLTQRLTNFSVNYYLSKVAPDSTQTIAVCDFFPSEKPDLNVSIPRVGLRRKPDYSAFPHVRTFENQSILEILTTVSSEQEMSFFCYRLDKDYVKATNKAWTEKKRGPTWWPNPDAPCYSVFWGTAWYGVRGKE